MIIIKARNELLFDETESDIIQTNTVEKVAFICDRCGEVLKCGEDAFKSKLIFKEQLWWCDEEDYQIYCPECALELNPPEDDSKSYDRSRDKEMMKGVSGRKK